MCRSCAPHGAAFHACVSALKGPGGTSLIVIRGKEEQMGCCGSGCAESFSAERADLPQQHGQEPLPQVSAAFLAGHSPVIARKKRKEKFTFFSDHNGSLLRRQPGATSDCMVAACMPLQPQFGVRLTNTACHWPCTLRQPACLASSLTVTHHSATWMFSVMDSQDSDSV